VCVAQRGQGAREGAFVGAADGKEGVGCLMVWVGALVGYECVEDDGQQPGLTGMIGGDLGGCMCACVRGLCCTAAVWITHEPG